MSRCPIRSTMRARRRAICSASMDRPTAVVCGNDVIAYGVLLEAERSGFSVPRDLSVVGFDDIDWSRHLRPSLTTIHVPTGETWQRAGEYLVRRLAGEQTIMHHEVDYSLVVREHSTAPPFSAPETTRTIAMTSTFSLCSGFSCHRDRRRRRYRRCHEQSCSANWARRLPPPPLTRPILPGRRSRHRQGWRTDDARRHRRRRGRSP